VQGGSGVRHVDRSSVARQQGLGRASSELDLRLHIWCVRYTVHALDSSAEAPPLQNWSQTIANIFLYLSIHLSRVTASWEPEAPLYFLPVDEVGFSSLYSSLQTAHLLLILSVATVTNWRWDIIGGKHAERRSYIIFPSFCCRTWWSSTLFSSNSHFQYLSKHFNTANTWHGQQWGRGKHVD